MFGFFVVSTPTPESPGINGGDEWLSGSEFRPPKERRNYTEKKPRDLSRGVFTFRFFRSSFRAQE